MKEMVIPLCASATLQLLAVNILGFAASSVGSLASLCFHILLMHLSCVLVAELAFFDVLATRGPPFHRHCPKRLPLGAEEANQFCDHLNLPCPPFDYLYGLLT